MDILSLLGLVLATVAILVGAVLKGAGIKALLAAAAFMIVVVGTIAAIFVQTPLQVMKRAIRIMPWVFKPPSVARSELIKKMVDWSNTARKQGLLGLESAIDSEPDDPVGAALGSARQSTRPSPSWSANAATATSPSATSPSTRAWPTAAGG